MTVLISIDHQIAPYTKDQYIEMDTKFCAAMEQAGYQPNIVAQALTTQKLIRRISGSRPVSLGCSLADV